MYQGNRNKPILITDWLSKSRNFAFQIIINMGVFNRLFSTSASAESKKDKNQSRIDWTPLISIEQLDKITAIESNKQVLIFKHSTRCGISSMVLKQFEQKFQPDENTVLYFLDLLRHRDISDSIAERFNVPHQSPQLLVIENGVCSNHVSHYGIVELIEG